MTNYVVNKFNLNDSQKNRIQSAIRNNSTMRIKLVSSLNGMYSLPLTHSEVAKLNSGSVMYTLSNAKIKFIRDNEKSGGFFFIPPIIAAIMAGVGAAGSVAGAAAGIAKAVNDKKAADEAQRLAEQQGEEAMAEQKRHNALMESAVIPPSIAPPIISGSGLGDELVSIINKIVRSSKHDLNTRERQLSGEIIYNLAKDLPVEVKGNGILIQNIPEALRGVVDKILGGLRSAGILSQKHGSGLFLGPPPFHSY